MQHANRRRKPMILGVLAVGLVCVAIGLYLFQPWSLWTDRTVDEALPGSAPSAQQSDGPSAVEGADTAEGADGSGQQGASGAPAEPADPEQPPTPAGPTTLATGDFITHEHATTGSVRIVELPDGSQVLRIENLDTSNGPDLKVWVTDAEVKPGRDGWGVFDDGAYLDLGELKGNKGSQNYALPSDADLDAYSSVSIWCDRFNVSFGAATLTRA